MSEEVKKKKSGLVEKKLKKIEKKLENIEISLQLISNIVEENYKLNREEQGKREINNQSTENSLKEIYNLLITLTSKNTKAHSSHGFPKRNISV